MVVHMESALDWVQPAGLLTAVGILAFCFAKLEVQIEGAAGWAAGLPTWRVERHPLLDIFWGGRPLTGYHAWAFTFMALVFHLPLALVWTFSLHLEARVAGCLALFWIAEDFLWFVLNPAFGLARFNRSAIWWHRRWWMGLPVDYWQFTGAGLGLLVYSYMG
jgi:hypothetical protein